MTQADDSLPSRLARWASRQLADYDAHNPGTLFAEGLALNVAEAYALQSAVAELRCERGERIVGYKVGCTSPKIRAQLGIDHCIAGRLYDSEQHAAGAVLSRSDFANLAIEGELAVELSREPIDSDFSEGEIPACVSRVITVIELHHHVMRGDQPSAAELIANNAIHAGVVAGSGVRPEDAKVEMSLSIFADDRSLDQCAGPALVETISSSLRWLMEFVGEHGESLHAGQIILTGSIPSLIPISEPCRIQVDAPPFGSVEAEIV